MEGPSRPLATSRGGGRSPASLCCARLSARCRCRRSFSARLRFRFAIPDLNRTYIAAPNGGLVPPGHDQPYMRLWVWLDYYGREM